MDIFGWVLAVISSVEFPFHAKGIVMNSITWSQINVPLPSNTEALSGKNFLEIAKKCMLIVNCNVICKSDGKFFMTAEILDPDLCYDEAEVVVQCWTSKKKPVVQGEKKSDGLYYLIQNVTLASYASSLKCCRHIPGFRMAIARTSETFQILVDYQATQNSFIWSALERDATTNVYTWSDGTLYDLSINTPVTDQGATRYVILNGRFNDHPSPSVPFPYLCQANFDGITW